MKELGTNKKKNQEDLSICGKNDNNDRNMLHRVRIYNPSPVAAKCMAGAPGRIAIGRDDGSIEVWSTRNMLFCIAQFDSPYKCVEAVAFAESIHDKKQLTLFSTGIDGRVVRYDE